MLESAALSFATYGTGLGSLTGSLVPRVRKRFAVGSAALTSPGGLTSSFVPYVLMCVDTKEAKDGVLNVLEGADYGFLNILESADNGLRKHVTGSEREQKDH